MNVRNQSIHSTLNITFEELLQYVWPQPIFIGAIVSHKDANNIKLILNDEMSDSSCKCFAPMNIG